MPEKVVKDRIHAQTPTPAQTIKLNLELLEKCMRSPKARGMILLS